MHACYQLTSRHSQPRVLLRLRIISTEFYHAIDVCTRFFNPTHPLTIFNTIDQNVIYFYKVISVVTFTFHPLQFTAFVCFWLLASPPSYFTEQFYSYLAFVNLHCIWKAAHHQLQAMCSCCQQCVCSRWYDHWLGMCIYHIFGSML